MLMPCFGKKSFWPEARHKALLVIGCAYASAVWGQAEGLVPQVARLRAW